MKAVDQKSQKHDTVFKTAMRDKAVAKDMIENYIPKDVVNKINLNSLEVCHASYVDGELKQFHSDMVYQVALKSGEDAYIYFLWEHQSTYDKYIAFKNAAVYNEYYARSH